MEQQYYHLDSFELFGKKFYRIIILPDETVFIELNKTVKVCGSKPDGFFWKKVMEYGAIKWAVEEFENFDFDAEKEAAIVCHESKDTLLQLCSKTFEMLENPALFKSIIPEIQAISLRSDEDDLLDFQE